MEIRDYIRMLKRGWPTVLLAVAVAVGLAGAYLAITPASYAATTVLYVTANDPTSITDLQQGGQFSTDAAVTYAQIIDSATVLGPVAATLRPQADAEDLIKSVTATVREETRLIDVTATGNDPARVAQIANAAAEGAIRVIPPLERGSDGKSLVRLQQVQRAVEPVRAVSPNVKRTLALGLVLGLFLGLSLTIAAQSLDTRIRTFEEIQHLTKSPILAMLPQMTKTQRQGLVESDDPTGFAGEAFRTLRTNVMGLKSSYSRTLLFSNVSEGREDAHVAANLAWAMAQTSYKVVLVDLDLRHSAVGNLLGLQPGRGLADVLVGHEVLSDVIRGAGHRRMDVILSGSSQASPSELLSTSQMEKVLRQLEETYDYVILHAPPLLTYTDAAVVARLTGGAVVVVRAGHTRAHALTAALTVLDNVRVPPLGVVLTGVRRSSMDRGAQPKTYSRLLARTPHAVEQVHWDTPDVEAPPHSARRVAE